jgi:hypothetical protein
MTPTEADRVRAWRNKKRGRLPRPYHKKRPPKGHNQFGGAAANLKRAAAIRSAWDDPLRCALMSTLKRRTPE